MPACSIVQIACASSKPRSWTVGSDGGLKLSSEAQFFVCHSKEEYGCIIQHLQSGAYVQQGPERLLRLTFDTASATEFTKLRADLPGNDGNRGAAATKPVWLRAATGGLVCPSDGNSLAVTINAAQDDDPAHWCSWILDTVDAARLAEDSSQMLSPSRQLSGKLSHSQAAVEGVSIGAKPISPFAIHRSSAVPISLKRPIRKVSLDDLADVAGNEFKSNPLGCHFPGSSSLSPSSYTVRDAVCDKIPASPICSMHSEASQSEDSKVRGGHLYSSDVNSSSNSLASQEPEDHGCNSQSSQAAQSHLLPQHSDQHLPAANRPPQKAANVDVRHMQSPPSFITRACVIDLSGLNLGSGSASEQGPSGDVAGSTQDDSIHSQDSGHKMHGGNFFSLKGHASMRSHKSSSALADPKASRPQLQRTSLPLPLPLRSSNGHKTHGSSNALQALSHSPSQRSRLLTRSIDADPSLARHKIHGSNEALYALVSSPSPSPSIAGGGSKWEARRHSIHGSSSAQQGLSSSLGPSSPAPGSLPLSGPWSQSSCGEQILSMHKTHGSSNALQALANTLSPRPTVDISSRSNLRQADHPAAEPSAHPPSPHRVRFSMEDMQAPMWPRTSPQTPGSMPGATDQFVHQTDSQTSGSLPASSLSSSEGQDAPGLLPGWGGRGGPVDTSPISVLGSRWPPSRQFHDAAEAFASPRSSGEYQREPSMPCILEGVPTSSAPLSMQDLLSRVQARTSHLHSGMKRVGSSPSAFEGSSSPAIHKVILRGSSACPAPPKRLHTGSQTGIQTCSQTGSLSTSDLSSLPADLETPGCASIASALQKVNA